MAVLAMKKVTICALTEQRKPLLEALQRKGTVQLLNELPRDEVFQKIDPLQACGEFERIHGDSVRALEVLDKYAPQKAALTQSLEGKPMLEDGRLTACVENRDQLHRQAEELNRLAKAIGEDQAKYIALQNRITSLKPWQGLEVPLNYRGTESTRAFIGTFSGDMTEEALLAALELPPEVPVWLQIVTHSKDQTCVFALCLKENETQVEEALRAAGFAYPAQTSELPPTEQIKNCEQQMAEAQQRESENLSKIQQMAELRNDIRLLADYYSIRSDKYAAMENLAQSEHAFILEGYVPEKSADSLKKLLEEKFGAVCELSEPGPDEEIPVAIQNSGFAAPVEGVLGSFSMPGKGEFDPSFMMALFYYFLFGMMLSDAGYGLLIVICCGFALHKFKNMDESLSKSLHMFLYGGISTVCWGILYGSWFGDAPTVIADLFFNKQFVIQPLWVNPIDRPMQMLMFCLLIGVIHLFTGLGCKAYLLVKQKDTLGLVADVISWYLLVGGLILFALSSPAFLSIVQLSFQLPAPVGTVGLVMAAAGAVIVVALGGRESKNPVLRLVKGLYALYGSTSWLGDILSYSRLLALGLATGVIGQVVNQMGSMGGRNIGGYILFIAVFLVGHTLNIAINLLGAYVHTNRLQFVEFFGKFYEGGGQPFTPFSIHTKYYRLKNTEE